MIVLYVIALFCLPVLLSALIGGSVLAQKKGGVIWQPWAAVIAIIAVVGSSPIFMMGVTSLLLLAGGGSVDFTPWFKETWFWSGWLLSFAWIPVLVLIIVLKGIEWDRPGWRAAYLGGMLSLMSVGTLGNLIGMIFVTLAVYFLSDPIEVHEITAPHGKVVYSVELNRFQKDQYVLYAQKPGSNPVFRRELGYVYMPHDPDKKTELLWSKDHQLLILRYQSGMPIMTLNTVTNDAQDYTATGALPEYIKLLNEHHGLLKQKESID